MCELESINVHKVLVNSTPMYLYMNIVRPIMPAFTTFIINKPFPSEIGSMNIYYNDS